MSAIQIRPFKNTDQAIARELVLAGMGARWGSIDYSLNPDLNDIQANYLDKGHLFFVGEIDGEIVATCALTNEAEGVWRIERMSVQSNWQRKGFGRILTNHLIDTAKQRNCKTLLVETERNWESAIQLYLQAGFEKTFIRGSEQHMKIEF